MKEKLRSLPASLLLLLTAACMLVLSLLCMLLPGRWPVPVSLLLLLPLIWLPVLLSPERLPEKSIPVTIPPELLLTGGVDILQAEAPVRPAFSVRMNAGPSMLLLTHAALLLLPNDPSGEAISRFFAPMSVDREALLRHMPILREEEEDGVRVIICRDGTGERAFACGQPQAIIPRCVRLQMAHPTLMNRSQREELLSHLTGCELTPYCYATAAMADGQPAEWIYLGAVLPVPQLQPWVQSNLRQLTEEGYTVHLVPTLAERLNTEPLTGEEESPVTVFAPEGVAQPADIPVPATLQPIHVLRRIQRTHDLLRACAVQLSCLAVVLGLGGLLFSTGLHAGVITSLSACAAALLFDRFRTEQAHRYPRMLVWLLCMLLTCIWGFCVDLFIRDCLTGGFGSAGLAILPCFAALLLQLRKQADIRSLSAADFPMLLICADLLLQAILSGIEPLAACFSLIAGFLLLILLRLLLDLLPQARDNR